MKRLIACQECKRQWDVTRYRVGQKLRCVCSHVMDVPRIRSHTPDVHHCQACGAARPSAKGACAYCGATPKADSARLSLVCPFCFRRSPQESQFCSSCGEGIHAAQLDAHTGNLKCPRCVKPKLVNRKVGDFTVDECPGCSGMWAGAEAFHRLVKQQVAREQNNVRKARRRGPAKSTLTEKVSYIKCPECGQMMSRFNFAKASGVIVDECRAHGVWLDSDELAKIAAYVSTGGLRHTETLNKLDKKLATSKLGVLGQSGQAGGISHCTTERDHDTPLGAVLELVGRLF